MAGNAHKTPFKDLMAFGHDLADLTGKTVLPYFRTGLSVENKAAAGNYDPVTKADRAAERVIAKALKARFPDHTLVGEEYGTSQGTSRYRWVVDPIDGTRAFIMGSPLWGTLIGLIDGDEPIFGLMDQPFTGERFWSDQKASYLRVRDGKPKRLKTRACNSLKEAILTSTHHNLFEDAHQKAVLTRFNETVRMTRYGGDCYGCCLLAAGFVDIVIEPGLKTYDIVALIPIIERAGGKVTSWTGGPASGGGNVIASGDPKLHEAALKLIAKAARS